jgi:hypothetical protein
LLDCGHGITSKGARLFQAHVASLRAYPAVPIAQHHEEPLEA